MSVTLIPKINSGVVDQDIKYLIEHPIFYPEPLEPSFDIRTGNAPVEQDYAYITCATFEYHFLIALIKEFGEKNQT